ncbi:MAG: hypothetical protein K2J08_02540 [Ruminococcus sp.]|nr:hypothetical protein [Ruminococcus sp.]
MEAVLWAVMIAVFCIIFRIDIILCAITLVCLVFVVMSVIFIYFTLRMIFSENIKAKFYGFEKYEDSRFSRACYKADGEIYPCIFPEEGILRDRLYRKDKIYKIRLDRKKKYVYDRFATATCIIGTIASTAITALAVAGFLMA